MATTVETRTTAGILGMWNGTKDGQEGFVDFSTGKTNVNEPLSIEIEAVDVRTQQPKPLLENEGYELINHTTKLTPEQLFAGKTPEGEQYLKDVYFPEIAELVKQHTGCEAVYPFAFRIRSQATAPTSFNDSALSQGALPVAHVDRDMVTGPNRCREALGDELAGELIAKHKRFAQINVWRPIDKPVQRWPLCFVGHTGVQDWSVDKYCGRVVRINDPRADVKMMGVKLHDNALMPAKDYTYHYVSNLALDEALIFSSFDTDESKVAPHGAFWDKSTADDAPTRRSIEVRLWVFFD